MSRSATPRLPFDSAAAAASLKSGQSRLALGSLSPSRLPTLTDACISPRQPSKPSWKLCIERDLPRRRNLKSTNLKQAEELGGVEEDGRKQRVSVYYLYGRGEYVDSTTRFFTRQRTD